MRTVCPKVVLAITNQACAVVDIVVALAADDPIINMSKPI